MILLLLNLVVSGLNQYLNYRLVVEAQAGKNVIKCKHKMRYAQQHEL
jgi:hypothetical protein